MKPTGIVRYTEPVSQEPPLPAHLARIVEAALAGTSILVGAPEALVAAQARSTRPLDALLLKRHLRDDALGRWDSVVRGILRRAAFVADARDPEITFRDDAWCLQNVHWRVRDSFTVQLVFTPDAEPSHFHVSRMSRRYASGDFRAMLDPVSLERAVANLLEDLR